MGEGYARCNDVERVGMLLCRPFFEWYSTDSDWAPVPANVQAREADSIFILEGDVTFFRDGRRESCECKFETDYTENLFFEWMSNATAPDRQASRTMRLGWFLRLNTDLLLCHFKADNQVFMFPVGNLMEWLVATDFRSGFSNYADPKLFSYELREQVRTEQKNRTVGFIVPVIDAMQNVPGAKSYVIEDGNIVDHPHFKDMRIQRQLFGIQG